VEENILKKANQKRILGDIAIEGGNFTTAFFKKQTIHDLFAVGGESTSSAVVSAPGTGDVLAEDEDRAEELSSSTGLTAAKKSIGAFESALATAEDDTDRQATSIARAEEDLDAADFSEQPEEEQQFQAVLAELSGAERYALRQMEEQEQEWARGQMQLAEAEIQARQEEFDVDKLDELTQVCLVLYFANSWQGCGSGMFIPDPNLSIPDPGSRVKKIPDPHQRI
jgi:flagellar biosynthesis GTPase FlhF